MKKSIITFLLLSMGFISFSQGINALNVDNINSVSIGEFDFKNLQFKETQSMVSISNPGFIPGDFMIDQKNGNAVYQDAGNNLVICRLENDQVTSRKLFFNSNIMAPAYIPSEEKVACFSIEKQFNGYRNNEDILFFSTIDINTGIIKQKIQLSELSFNSVNAPFYGTVETFTGGLKKTVKKEVVLSNPVYIPEKGLYLVLIKDVTGTNRMYKIRVHSPKAAVASNRCNYNIIDMAHVRGTETMKTLYFTTDGLNNTLHVGDFDLETNSMSNSKVVGIFDRPVGDVNGMVTPVLNNGSIKFNKDQSALYVTYYNSKSINTNIFSIDVNSNTATEMINFSGSNMQFDFGYSETDYKPYTYNNVYTLFPNPSKGKVYFKNETGIIPNSLIVYNTLGQEVRNLRVQEVGSMTEIDLSDMTPGIYHLKADMPGEDFNGKIIITD
ncbi:MAG: T9SS type A sorting domain-containing protein [Flavobacteriales bacterium]|nr:T9SS type A sorting domain-containing protein [Flavobacteriales bacterium]